MKKSDIPRQVPIGGLTLKVCWYSEDEMEDWGQLDMDGLEIKLSEKCLRAGNAEETLLHEMCHAATHISGLRQIIGSKTDEAVVRAFDYILFPAIRKLLSR